MLNKLKQRGQGDISPSLFGRGSGIAALIAIYVFFGFAQAANEYRVMFLESQGLTATQCGQILAASGLLCAVSRPLAGALADKLRSRRIVYIGSVTAWIAVMVLMVLLQNVRLAGFVLCAGIVPLMSVTEPVTYGMIESSGVTATLRYPKLDFSLIRVCLSIGYSAINFLYTPIVNKFGPTAPFYCTAVFAAVMLILSGAMRKFESEPAQAGGKVNTGGKLEFKRLFQNYFLMAFVLLNFVSALGSHATQGYLFYLLQEVDLDTSLVGIVTGIRVVGEVIIMPFVPMMKKKISLPMMCALSSVFCMLQITLYLLCHNPVVIIAGAVLNGFAVGISLGSTAVYLRMMAPEGLDTTTLSLSTVMSSFGSILINLVGGMVVDQAGVFALYRLSILFQAIWFVLYFGSWAFGVYVLKKKPPMPMFLKNAKTSD